MEIDYNNIKINNTKLRKAIYQAFDGKCFYSNQKLDKNNFHIDHVLPKSKGGRDSIYNYVLCSPYLNMKKQAKINDNRIEGILYYIELNYVNKIKKLIKKNSGIKLNNNKIIKKNSKNHIRFTIDHINKSLTINDFIIILIILNKASDNVNICKYIHNTDKDDINHIRKELVGNDLIINPYNYNIPNNLEGELESEDDYYLLFDLPTKKTHIINNNNDIQPEDIILEKYEDIIFFIRNISYTINFNRNFEEGNVLFDWELTWKNNINYISIYIPYSIYFILFLLNENI